MTRIYSYTLKLSAFLLRGRGGARFRSRWMDSLPLNEEFPFKMNIIYKKYLILKTRFIF